MNRTSVLKSAKLSGAYLLGLGVVIFFTILCPEYVQFPYSFRDGQIWSYDDLYAPFDFPVFKTPEEVLAEEENLRTSFAPYYSLDRTLPAAQEERLEQIFTEQLNRTQQQGGFEGLMQNPSRHLNYGKYLLQQIYQKGIVEIDSLHKPRGDELVIELISGNASQRKTRQQLLDLEQVQEVLLDSLPNSGLPYAEFLFPILAEALVPNITYNDSLTSLYFKQQLSEGSQASSVVSEGELIIRKGGRIQDDEYRKLLSFQRKYQDEQASRATYFKIMLGYFLLAFFIVGLFMLYIQVYEPRAFNNFKELIFLLMWPSLYSYLMYLIELTDGVSPYLIPFCIAPIVIGIFYNARLAFFTHLVVILLVSILTSQGYEFTIIQIIAGIIAVMSNPDARNWTRFFGAMIYILLAYVFIYLGLTLIQEGSFLASGMVVYAWFFASVFLTLLAYPMIPLLERLFGFVSSVSLMELSDMNRPVLKELALKAPGTLQHSLQVGNLAEAAADAIGANSLLVRVAALYHDIGKTVQPEYFIENQSGVNPHDALEQKDSAAIIIGHVKEGVRLARKHRVPDIITRFIQTHHGTTRVEYFYRSHCQDCEDGEKDIADFTYPGPKPKTKEESILMLADSLEASSKSLKNPTSENIDELVNAIIQTKINLGQLEESELTFQELETCRIVFRKILQSIHHVRVEYPK